MREKLRLERGERVLAMAGTRGGSHVVVTRYALYVPDGEDGLVRVPWEKVLRASWNDEWLHVWADEAEYHVRLTEPGAVPSVVQERVTSTVVVSRYFTFGDDGGVRIVGRRATHDRPSPAPDGLLWSLVYDADLDSTDPGVKNKAEQLLLAVRREVGL
ncbi:hypothetical protein LO762_18065 [Actinocorallia sp. API 0066]|uniref:hypothetical protein n=1 Tax=Actinocorallia sp. API 0066 TaxID=2896846 RepID=UPI001E4C54C5|nr:hypothetical protein [Actinocorallia sp. API 0066]MCD0451088.1 hypothetical protein [Actinocorallia sp. API 0066]